MKTLAQTLTVLLAILLIAALPVTADDCCTPAPCCPAGACHCHMSATTSQPAPEIPATLPTLPDALAPTVTTLLNVVPMTSVHFDLPVIAATFSTPPLYALTHAFLI